MNFLNQFKHLILAFSCCMLLTSCASLPQDRIDYVGYWSNQTSSLKITADGQFHFSKRSKDSNTSVNAPIQSFSGDSVVVGIGPLSSTYIVSKRPYQEGSLWKMVIEGETLIKLSNGDEARFGF